MTATTYLDIIQPLKTEGFDLDVVKRAEEALWATHFPTQKQEQWKYTSLQTLLERNYQLGKLKRSQNLNICNIPDTKMHTFLFVNGQYYAGCLNPEMAEKAILRNFNELTPEELPIFAKYFGNIAASPDETFTALNTRFGTQGMFIYIPSNYHCETPIHIQHLTDTEGDTIMQHRNVVVVGENASVKIVETYHGVSSTHTFRNAVTEIFVAKNGNLEYVKFQNEGETASHIENTTLTQGIGSQTGFYTITLEGELVRNNLTIRLIGEHAHATLNGGYILNNTSHVDNHTEVHHKVPNCTSSELYKGVIDDKATAVFSGKIQVYPDAQKTQAYQSNRNILLSDTANAYTKPQLEIYADDVKCSHGATTGQMNEDALFYMRARGIAEAEARKILLRSFLADVKASISMETVRAYLKSQIHQHL